MLSAPAVGQESGGTLYRWKLAEGDQFEIRMVQNTSTETVVDVRTVAQSSDMTLTLDWQVESVDEDGTARIRQTISAIQARVVLPESDGPVTVEYDSANERHSGRAKQLADSFSRLIGQPVFVTMTSRGEITDVEIPEETMESLRQMPGSMEGRQAFSLESIREMFQASGTSFPEAAIGPGQSWKVSREFNIGTPHQLLRETTCTPGDNGRIDFSSTLSIRDIKPPDSDSSVETTPWTILSQESGGHMVFDAEAGHPVSSQSKTALATRSTYHALEVTTKIDSSIEIAIQKR
jgi:hypothetical protein